MTGEKVNELAESLTDFCNGLEAIVVKLRRQIQTLEETEDKAKWNASKIKWFEAEGFKGKYQRSEDVNSVDFKNLLKDLAEHNGNLTREGWFYWVFKNGSTVGRKKREVKA